MKMLRCWLICLAFVVPAAMAASRCPLIRPAGLSPQQVDAVVADTYARWLRKPVAGLDTSRTYQALDGTDTAVVTYVLATTALSESLGVDLAKAFSDAAQAKGAKQPLDSLPLAELQALARESYAKGQDGPPPTATPGVDYAVFGLPVQVPSAPAGDWRLVRCGQEDVTFVQRRADGIVAASLRNVSLGPYVSDADFLKELEAAMRTMVAPGYKVRPWTPTIVAATSRHCADAAVTADEAGSGAQYYLRLRACYVKPDRSNTQLMLYSRMATAGNAIDPAPAEDFIRATSPK